MKIIIVHDIDDNFLKTEWERLEKECNIFPQSTHHWCATWWKALGEGRRLHIVLVQDKAGLTVGIAPFIIDNFCGLRYLRSIPENYGDFYTFLVAPGYDTTAVHSAILMSLQQFSTWHSILLVNVNSASPLAKHLEEVQYPIFSHVLTKNVVTKLNFSNFDGYLGLLSKNRRRFIRKKQCDFELDFVITCTFSTETARYLECFDEISELQRKRGEIDRPQRSSVYMQLVRESLGHAFATSQMCLLEVRADGRLAAYRLGFLHNNIYYDWNTSYEPDFETYSPGSLSIAYLMEQLRQRGVERVDFMAGYYDYKVSYSPAPEIREQRLYLFGNGSWRSRLIIYYFLTGREQIKKLYNRLRRLSKAEKSLS